jgi:hypothetical protein
MIGDRGYIIHPKKPLYIIIIFFISPLILISPEKDPSSLEVISATLTQLILKEIKKKILSCFEVHP